MFTIICHISKLMTMKVCWNLCWGINTYFSDRHFVIKHDFCESEIFTWLMGHKLDSYLVETLQGLFSGTKDYQIYFIVILIELEPG